MISGLGAAGSLIDALSSLTSPKSSSATTSTGQSQGAANPFDPDGSTQTRGTTGFSAGDTGGPSFSPQTMSAMIQAQGQPGATGDPASTDANTADSGTNSSGIQTGALINMMDKIKLQPIDVSQLKITKLDTTNLVNTASFDARL